MGFRRATVEVDGDTYTLRELSGADLLFADEASARGDVAQAMALVAVSIESIETTDVSLRGFPGSDAPQVRLQWVQTHLPARVLTKELGPKAGELNGFDLSDAEGN